VPLAGCLSALLALLSYAHGVEVHQDETTYCMLRACPRMTYCMICMYCTTTVAPACFPYYTCRLQTSNTLVIREQRGTRQGNKTRVEFRRDLNRVTQNIFLLVFSSLLLHIHPSIALLEGLIVFVIIKKFIGSLERFPGRVSKS
jgi:hypothetical protein